MKSKIQAEAVRFAEQKGTGQKGTVHLSANVDKGTVHLSTFLIRTGGRFLLTVLLLLATVALPLIALPATAIAVASTAVGPTPTPTPTTTTPTPITPIAPTPTNPPPTIPTTPNPHPASSTIAQLAAAGPELDGQSVTITGEAVGDILNADGGSKWLLLHDDDATISVYLDEVEAAKVTHLGRYGQVGTRLEVSGVFATGCAQHDGLSDVHAVSVKVIDEGHKVGSSFNSRALATGGILVAVGIGLLLLQWRLRERTR